MSFNGEHSSDGYSERMIKNWLREHIPQAQAMKDQPAFFRNIERTLDAQREGHNLMTAKPRWPKSIIDLTSSDFLSLNRSGLVRDAFLKELENHSDYQLSAAGSRVQYGNYDYLIQVEKEIADFHGAETAYIGHSGFFCNVGIVASVPRPGDAVVYDELVHASTHDGLKLSMAAHKISFKHNDPDDLREVLQSLKELDSGFSAGTKSVLICVESIYSMNGDICPLRECVGVAKEVFPLGNAQFVIDEAHSTGVIGPQGRGLVALLGLEKEIAIRIHMCSKAIASTGGVIMCNKTIRRVIINQVRFAVYSGAPSFAMVAAIRAGFQLLQSGVTKEIQDQLQVNMKYFFKTLEAEPNWQDASDEGIVWSPLLEDWESRPVHSHIVPLRTKNKYEQYLFFHLILNDIQAYNVSFPIVPKGTTRVRLVFHAHNGKEQIDKLVRCVCDWAGEMLDIEAGKSENQLPSAARQVYAMQADLERP